VAVSILSIPEVVAEGSPTEAALHQAALRPVGCRRGAAWGAAQNCWVPLSP